MKIPQVAHTQPNVQGINYMTDESANRKNDTLKQLFHMVAHLFIMIQESSFTKSK